LLWKKERICVPKSKKVEVLREGYDIATVGHLEGRKMYKTLRQGFYWIGMKRKLRDMRRHVKSARRTKH
jgi:Integrase zinc binding domain